MEKFIRRGIALVCTIIDEMQDEIKQQKEVIEQKDSELQELQQKMKELQEELERRKM